MFKLESAGHWFSDVCPAQSSCHLSPIGPVYGQLYLLQVPVSIPTVHYKIQPATLLMETGFSLKNTCHLHLLQANSNWLVKAWNYSHCYLPSQRYKVKLSFTIFRHENNSISRCPMRIELHTCYKLDHFRNVCVIQRVFSPPALHWS